MLLSYRYKIPGFILIFIGLILTILYFSVEFRFEMPVLAVFSSYIETRFFTTFSTNFADELTLLILLAGFSLVVFSKEKKEFDFFQSLRINALVKTAIINVAFLIFSVMFIYGNGFIMILLLNMFFPFIVYLGIFNFMKFKEIKAIIQSKDRSRKTEVGKE
jgi:amino acid transporter